MPSFLQAKHVWLIRGARALALLSLALIIAAPSRTVRRPATANFKLVLLADASKSMQTTDDSGESRLAKISSILKQPGFIQNLQSTAKLETYLFADTVVPFELDGDLSLSSSHTDLGAALQKILEHDALGLPVGAVVVLSDGRVNAGPSPQSVAKQFAQADIPISTCLVAESARPVDIAVTASDNVMEVPRDQPFTLQASISANNPAEQDVNVQLLHGGLLVAESKVHLPKQATNVPVSFTVVSPMAGCQVYAVKIVPDGPDALADNNVDFFSVQVKRPPVFKVLYLAETLDLDWRFLSQLSYANKQFSFSALIKIKNGQEGQKDLFFTANLDENQLVSLDGKFPEKHGFYAPFDCVVADSRVFRIFSPKALDALTAFVENKGGGLVVKGPLDALPETVRKMLPVRQEERQFMATPVRLTPNPQFIFTRNPASPLFSPQGVYTPPMKTLALFTELKKSTRSAMDVSHPAKPSFLAAHAYSAGRLALLASESTWLWKLSSDAQQSIYEDFWTQLLVFLAETGKPRFNCLNNGQKVALDEPTDIMLDVLGTDFLPAPDARIQLRTTAPDGSVFSSQLSSSLHELGRYEMSFTPTVPGEYLLSFDIDLPEPATANAVLIARASGHEAQNITPDATVLQDIARITSGKFYTPQELVKAQIPLSSRIPMTETRVPLIPPALLYSVFAVSSLFAWWFRRRLGLK